MPRISGIRLVIAKVRLHTDTLILKRYSPLLAFGLSSHQLVGGKCLSRLKWLIILSHRILSFGSTSMYEARHPLSPCPTRVLCWEIHKSFWLQSGSNGSRRVPGLDGRCCDEAPNRRSQSDSPSDFRAGILVCGQSASEPLDFTVVLRTLCMWQFASGGISQTLLWS